MRLPNPIRISEPHLQNATVAVDIFNRQPFDSIVVVRIGAGARPHPFRLVRKRPFRAVRIDTGTDVERSRVQRAGDVGVMAVAADQQV